MKRIIVSLSLIVAFLQASSYSGGKEEFKNALLSAGKTNLFGMSAPVKTSASVGEVEVGNMLQAAYLTWSKSNFNSNRPSFVDQENIMRIGGCSVSYHRCYYKGAYYSFAQLATTSYKKINLAMVQRPGRSSKKKIKKTGKTIIIHGPNAVYVQNNEPMKTTPIYTPKIPKTASMSPFGIGDPSCVAKVEGGVLPKLPSSKREAFNPKALPCISTR